MNQICLSKVDEELECGQGFYLGFHFLEEEVQVILDIIREQWLERIKQKSPETWKQFSEIDLTHYHELSSLLDHGSTWIKGARIFSKSAVKKIKKMSLIKALEEEFGVIEIVDEEGVGYEEIDWRLVRPNQPTDVGPFHADAWFSDLGHGVKPIQNKKAVKVWIALCCEPGLNGLNIVPHSQKKEWRYHGEMRHGFVKPQIDEDEKSLSSVLLNTLPGAAVLFHDKLLHAGAINKGKYTRISMEFMIFVNKRQRHE